MQAVCFDGALRYTDDYPPPVLIPGWAIIKVKLSGICGTDMEIIKGYKGFTGILGHEFVGTVDECGDSEWVGKRVIGEINASCGNCAFCKTGLGRHCPSRRTLGILNLDGCMASYCTLPIANLMEVPPEIPDERAVLTEPLAAACEIMEQIPFRGDERVAVLGDGRLGILCAWAISTVVRDLTLVGRHPEKLELAKWRDLKTTTNINEIEPYADIVVEATGSPRGIIDAFKLCKPRGTIVLKSTLASQVEINLSPIVVKELTVVGSRCGRFRDAVTIMTKFPSMPMERLIVGRFPLSEAKEAFEMANEKGTLKVLLTIQ